jgi:hypothetical protein
METEPVKDMCSLLRTPEMLISRFHVLRSFDDCFVSKVCRSMSPYSYYRTEFYSGQDLRSVRPSG